MPGSERRAELDGLRGVAALSVVVLHAWLYSRADPSRPLRHGVLDRVAFELRLGFVFFFVLSGYLLYRGFARAAASGARRVDLRRYARRRIARIVPAYYLAIASSLALLWGAGGEPGVRLPDAHALPIFLVFGQSYSGATVMRLDPVTWTLCVEVLFYLALPLIGLAACRFARAQTRVLVALIGAGVAWNAVAFAARWGEVAHKALPAYLPCFALGMAIAVWRASRPRAELTPRAGAWLVAGGLALVVLDAVWHATAGPPAHDALLSIGGDMPAAVGFAALIGAAVAGRRRAVAWMSLRPFTWVGLVSYGMFLWQVPLLLFARHAGVLPHGFLAALAFVVPASLTAGALSWYLVERPLLARAERAPQPMALLRTAEAHAAP